MNYIEAIQRKLTDITPISERTIHPAKGTLGSIKYNENPLNSSLFSYCFEKILGFKVDHHIFEKVDYVIDFSFQGVACHVIDCKHEFTVTIRSDLKPRFVDLMKDVKFLLEDFFLECGKVALENNAVTMENCYPQYRRKYLFYEKKVSQLESRINAVDRHLGKLLRKERNNKEIWNTHNRIQGLLSDWKYEQEYTIEAYIDTFFSLLEHLLTLLFPFTSSFNPNASYSKQYVQNIRWTWAKKLEDVCGTGGHVNQCIKDLREIKEVYRNRSTHGMFSREFKMYTEIDGFGRYPMFLGKEYLKGFTEKYNTSLSYDKFKEISVLFRSSLEMVENMFPIPMAFIERGIDVPVITSELINDIHSIDEADERAEYLLYLYDRNINMDW